MWHFNYELQRFSIRQYYIMRFMDYEDDLDSNDPLDHCLEEQIDKIRQT